MDIRLRATKSSQHLSATTGRFERNPSGRIGIADNHDRFGW
jgi:hypothetical protein